MNNKILLFIVGLILCLIGLLKPNLNFINTPSNKISVVSVDKPSNETLLKLAQDLVQTIHSNKVTTEDGLRLANLCSDIAMLISFDGVSEVIKNTEEIRQANRLSGMMLRMDMNKKYPDLANKMNALVVGYIGDDIVPLNPELRTKSSDVFKALAWAFVEGTK